MTITIKRTGFDQFANTEKGVRIKALILGEHGVGKTPSAANWPKPLILDCEGGLMSVAKMAVPYVEVKTPDDMMEGIRAAVLDSRKKDRQFETLVIDTVDTFQRSCIQQRLRVQQKDRLSGWEDWGWLDGKMTQLLDALLNYEGNVVVNSHVKDISDQDGDDSILVKKVRLKGDVKDTIFQDFDLIGLMETSFVIGDGTDHPKGERVEVRHIRWHREPRYPMLRDRSFSLPQFTPVTFTAADYTVLFDKITADLDSIPASEDIETLTAPEEVAEPEAPAEQRSGGPVAAAKIPPAKAAAKKAAAKKAAPSKPEAATPVAEEAKAEAAVETPETPAPSALNGKGTADVPVVLPAMSDEQAMKVIGVLDHVHAIDGRCLANTFGGLCDGADKLDPWAPPVADAVAEETPEAAEAAEAAPEEPAEAPATPEPTPEPQQQPVAQAAKAERFCGDQPDSMQVFPAAQGCGEALNSQTNAVRAQVGVLKFKTYLCDDCHDKAAANAA